MKTEKLVEQLDLYSNAIVGFMVAQSIAFSFTFGTNVPFGCEITQYKLLAAGLMAHFVSSTAVACWAVIALARRMSALSSETDQPLSDLGHETLRIAAIAKAVVIALFVLIPVGLLLSFGLLGDTGKGRCARQAAAQVERPAQLGDNWRTGQIVEIRMTETEATSCLSPIQYQRPDPRAPVYLHPT